MGIYNSGITSEQVREILRKEQAELGTADVARIAGLANMVHYRAGVLAALEKWEAHLADVEKYASDSPNVRLLLNLAEITKLLGRDPDDTWGGRTGDARRSFNDGGREVLNDIAAGLRTQVQNVLP